MSAGKLNSRDKKIWKIILISCVLTSGVIGFAIHVILLGLFYSEAKDPREISLYITIIVTFLFTLNLLLSGILFMKRRESNSGVKELNSFKDFTDVLYTSSSEVEVYENLVHFIQKVVPVTQVTLFYRTVQNIDDVVWRRFTNEKMPLCNMSHRHCPLVVQGRECYVNNIEHDITCAYQLQGYKKGGYVCLMIEQNNKVIGVMQLYSNKKMFFNDSLISKVKSYIEFVKPIIKSKKALSDLNKEAYTDKLTGAYNRAYLEHYLENEFESSKISGKRLSIIMLDIDHFKKFNDTYGHTTGDLVLEIFVKVIKRCLRNEDNVFRYGGEEFLVMLPSTNSDKAFQIAERIRKSIEEEKMPNINSLQIASITCSLGIATFPIHTNNREGLIKLADIALYKAKAAGRNCVKVYNEKMGRSF